MPKAQSQPYAIAALTGVAILLLLSGLGATDLWAPDEPRYGGIAEELRSMQHGPGGLLLLHSNGEPYTQKPPLYYWLAASFGALSGHVDEWAARLPSALAGVACISLTMLFGGRLFANPAIGLWAGVILLSVFRYAHLARRAQLDVLLTLFELLALIAFYRLETKQGTERANLIGLHASLALALLTKGPVGLLPLAVIATFLLLEGRASELRRLFPPWSPLLTLGPITLWLAAALMLAPPGFFDEAVVENLFGRFFSGSSHARPLYYFLYQFPIDFLPWSLLWPVAAVTIGRALRASKQRGGKPGDQSSLRLLLVWVSVSLLFFSLSAGKRGLYLLPVFPAAALLTAHALTTRLAAREAARGLFTVIAGIAALLFFGGMWVALSGGIEVPGAPGFTLPSVLGVTLACVTTLWAATEYAMRRQQASNSARMLLASGAWLAVLGSVFSIAYPAFDEAKSPRPVAQTAVAFSAARSPLGIYDQRALVGGVAYYSGRKVEHLMTATEVERFLSVPGHVVILKSRKLERLASELGGLTVRARLRSGKRELVVADRTSPRP